MPRTSLPDHSVIFKGIEQGILILLDKSFDYERIIKKAIQKIKANKKFLSENALFITGTDGPLDPDEIGMARKMIRDKTKMEVLPMNNWEAPSEISEPIPEPIHETAPPTFVRNNLRAGQELQCDGDLILFGDAHPGSKIIAGGSVIVFGKVYGEIHAGQPDHKKVYIAAEIFDPIRLSIAGVTTDQFLDSQCKKNWVYVQLQQDKIAIFPKEDGPNE